MFAFCAHPSVLCYYISIFFGDKLGVLGGRGVTLSCCFDLLLFVSIKV